MRLAPLMLILVLAACAGTMQWPTRGGLVCVRNDQTVPMHVVAEDELGRRLEKPRVWPGQHIRFRWPWITRSGQLLAGERRTVLAWSSHPFEPWTADRWSWRIGDVAVLPDTGKVGRC